MVLEGWRRRAGAATPRTADGAAVAALLGLFALEAATGRTQPGQRPVDLLVVLLTLVMVAPVLVHRRAPVLAALVTLTAVAGAALLHTRTYPGFAAFALLYLVCLHTDDQRRRRVVFAATVLTLLLAVSLQPAGVADPSTWVTTLLVAVVAGLGGDNLRHRRQRWAALEERARLLETEREERARRAVLDERVRIARELHDVVAHSMSVIAVQAGVGRLVLDTQPQEARSALAAIETTSRTALTEMRRLLGVLREEGRPRAALSPAPGLADLPALLAQVRDAGLDVASTVLGDPATASPPVDLTAYRIVQEALTNALKHGGPTAAVCVEYDPDELRLTVTSSARPGVPRARTAADGAGHGLIGMRERVAAFGGDLSAGSPPDGGFRVAARLPASGGPS